MFLDLVFIIVGIVMVLYGADRLTDGAVAIAQKMNVSQMVIGLTVVAMGTSMPEFSVSLVSALKGTSDLAVGNVVGSNIFNSLCILGITAMVSPMMILKTTVRKDVPFSLVSSVIFMMMCFDGEISRFDASIMFVILLLFMYMTLKGAQVQKSEFHEEAVTSAQVLTSTKKPMAVWLSVTWIVVGLVLLIGGSNMFVDGATKIASSLGVSEAVIGLTIVAGGTSLPELATSVVAARKGESGIAIGNVIGSNVFNILAILGLTGMIQPMVLQGITMFDISVMVTAMMLVWLFSFTKYVIERWEGLILLLVYIGYTTKLIMSI